MKIVYILSFLFALTLLTSCNEEIDFGGDHQEVPIVYGLLDTADVVHYIKITRSFAGDNNSIDVAKIADSSYFKELEVTIKEVIDGKLKRTFILEDTILNTKTEGAFYGPEQKLYYFKTPSGSKLSDKAVYQLTAIANKGTDKEFSFSGETRMVAGVSIASPTAFGSYAFYSGDKFNNFGVKFNKGNASILNSKIVVFYNEFTNNVAVEKSFTWNLGDVSGAEATKESIISAPGELFYELVRDNVTPSASVTKRSLSRIQLIITAGSADLNKYIEVNKPSSSLAQNKPTFTNLRTSDNRPVIGIFSSRSRVFQEKQAVPSTGNTRALDQKSTEQLCIGDITKGLSFCSSHILDKDKIWYCN